MKPGPLSPDAAERIAECLRALADPTRLRILDLLHRQEEVSAGEIAARLGGSQQNVSKHLSVLRAERLVVRRKQGARSLYRLADATAQRFCAAADLLV